MSQLIATYRLQLRGGMTFAKARGLVDYWHRLGVSHVYLSPVLKARKASTHGYDVVDPMRVDTRLGGERGLRALADALGQAGLGILLDIVPNHQAADPENPYFADLLHKGRASRYADWFDIDWKETQRSQKLSYRRFFDINELIALRIEDPRVFEATHAKTLELLRYASVDGVRIDHIDGLANPGDYLKRLRQASQAGESAPTLIFVEKILAPDESLRGDWPVDGTTGYEFLNQLDAVFLDAKGMKRLDRDWRRLVRRPASFHHTARACKRLVLKGGLAPDVYRLARELSDELDAGAPVQREIRRALIETIAALPVYRTYVDDRGRRRAPEREWLRRALKKARRAQAPKTALRYLESHLGTRNPRGRSESIAWQRRFEQLSGPAAAKGVEDTAFYRYGPLLSRNEVGGEPDTDLEAAIKSFHLAARQRQRRWPSTLLAASTHDTKRSADARARLGALSELPELWKNAQQRWARLNRKHRRTHRGRSLPDSATELLLYQTLAAVWPLRPSRDGPPSSAELTALEERVQLFMRKAGREAKLHSSWHAPNRAFEETVERFIHAILRPQTAHAQHAFVWELDMFVREISRPGLWTALARQLVHLTAPGVPDLYQGDELWTFTLVDPDNRYPVDFSKRRRMLQALQHRFTRGGQVRHRLIAEIVRRPEDGRIKLHLTERTLQTRARHAELFHAGTYHALRARGSKSEHVFGFMRKHGNAVCLIVVPRLTRRLLGNGVDAPCGDNVWQETRISLPPAVHADELHSPLTGERIHLDKGTRTLALGRLLGAFPVGLWLGAGD